MTESEYVWAWGTYLAGAGVLYLLFWYFVRKIPFLELRLWLRMLLAVVLFIPWTTDKQHDFLSPAWIVSISDSLLYEPNAFWRAGLAVVLSAFLATVASVGISIFLWFRRAKKSQQSSQTSAADEAASNH